MSLRFRDCFIVAATLSFSLLVHGCIENPARDEPGGSPCSSSDSTVFLRSKLDDDDGDGKLFDEYFPHIDDEDDDIADHTWCLDGSGVHHLFFQNEDHGAGNSIQHYVSTDLRSLTYVGVALEKNPGGWDSAGLWAPHVVRYGDTYFMFYTGIDGAGNCPGTRQRIGLATSSDLVTWTRYPVNRCPGTSGDGCIYECAECWTAWEDKSGWYNQQCRDAFVIRDPAQQRWVLFATAKSLHGSGVITVAYSKDLIGWTGAGYIDATRRLPGGTGGQPTGGQAENPMVLSHAGTYDLLFTDWQDPEDSWKVSRPRTLVQYVSSSSLTADSSGSHNWVYRGYTPDPGVNAIEAQVVGDTWVLSQSICNPDCADHSKHRRELRLMRVVWGEGYDFSTVVWHPPAACARPAGLQR